MNFRKQLSISEMIALLERLKTVEVQYPPELLAARRAAFISQVQAARSYPHGKGQGPGGDASGGSHLFMESLLQYVLAGFVVALVATTAYFYGDTILDTILGNEVTQIFDSELVTQQPTEINASPMATVTMMSTATLVQATSTPVPFATDPQPPTTIVQPTSTAVQPTSTVPQPTPTIPRPTSTPQPTSTKPGNRYGHTKTPQP